MGYGNEVIIAGNCTRDPDLRFTPNGTPTASFGLAVEHVTGKDDQGKTKRATAFFDVVCWAKLADNVAESVAKGDRLIVSGTLEQRSWETNNGEKRSKTEIKAEDVGLSLKWGTAHAARAERHEAPPPQQASYGSDWQSEEPF